MPSDPDEVSAHDDQVNRNLFEMKQEELEKAVENLSKLVETPLEEMLKDGAIAKIKQAILDLTVNVDSRSLRLCETVQNDILGRLATPHGIAPYRARSCSSASRARSPVQPAAPAPWGA